MRSRSGVVAFIALVSLTACGGNPPTGPSNNAPAATQSPTAPSGGGSAALVTLADVTLGLDVTSGGTGTFNWAGQSVTIPAGRFDNLSFQWYTSQKTPAAFGTLYLLDRDYLGLPRDLSSATPGFVARSEVASSGVYLFAPSVAVDGGRQYWFYTDTQGSFAGSFDTDIYTAGDLYVTGYPTNPFRKAPASGRMVGGVYVPPPAGVFVDANFRLVGRAAGF